MVLAKALRWTGLVLLWGAALVIVGGDVVYVVRADNSWRAFWQVLDQYSPFNLGGFLVRMAFLAPGGLLLWLSGKAAARSRSQQNRPPKAVG
jgi:hypothetical protein